MECPERPVLDQRTSDGQTAGAKALLGEYLSMGNITKKDLVERIAERTGLTQVDTKIVVESFLEALSQALQSGRNIEIRGFGRFKIKSKKARVARNPRTNEHIQVEAGFKPIFEASKDLRKRVDTGYWQRQEVGTEQQEEESAPPPSLEPAPTFHSRNQPPPPPPPSDHPPTNRPFGA